MSFYTKRMSVLGAVAALALVLSACDTSQPGASGTESVFPGTIFAATAAGADAQSVPLIAGQNETIGQVSSSVDDDILTVTYMITEPEWCITSWHLDVGLTVDDLLNGKKRNPAPGSFPYGSDEDCELTVSQSIPLSDIEGYSDGATVLIAAHAVVNTGERCGAFVYGIQRDTGDIFRIYLNDLADLDDNEAVLNFDISESLVITSPADYPNSLATGEGVLYFGTAEHEFYAIDVATGTVTLLGTLEYLAASGVYAGGAFWYVPQGNNRPDNLQQVIPTPFGESTYCENFSVADEDLQFGDIEVDGTTIYGSARENSDATQGRFFTIDISGGAGNCVFTPIGGANEYQLQLAFDQDSNLIGHAASDEYDEGMFYKLIYGDDSVALTELGYTLKPDGSPYRFNDLSRGPDYDCSVREETAWAAGQRFTNRGSWATYFSFTP